MSRHLRPADHQDATLARLKRGAEVEVTLRGRVVDAYTANGVLCVVIQRPTGERLIATPLDGDRIVPTGSDS